MTQQAKQIIEERVRLTKQIYSNITIEAIVDVLNEFTEHPTKPGYKRQDIEYFIKLIEDANT
jgi:hypothetical protein